MSRVTNERLVDIEFHMEATPVEISAMAEELLERRALDLTSEGETAEDGEEEAYQIGKQEGYDQAVQDIDRLTGGDGEYRFCTDRDPDRHTPDAETMKQRIVDRFTAPQPAWPDLERFEPNVDEECGEYLPVMDADPEGGYVNYPDAQAHIAALTAKIQELEGK